MSSKYVINFEKIKENHKSVTAFCEAFQKENPQFKGSLRQDLYQIHEKTRLNSKKREDLYGVLKKQGYAGKKPFLKVTIQ